MGLSELWRGSRQLDEPCSLQSLPTGVRLLWDRLLLACQLWKLKERRPGCEQAESAGIHARKRGARGFGRLWLKLLCSLAFPQLASGPEIVDMAATPLSSTVGMVAFEALAAACTLLRLSIAPWSVCERIEKLPVPFVGAHAQRVWRAACNRPD